jgi:parallel beta-helix repeat protein
VHCGQVITASIRLANDLADCPADGLLIGADRITVDLNSHTIDGVLGSDVGAGIDNAAGHSGVRVRNGTVSEFSVAIQMSGAADAVQPIAVHGYFQAGIRFAGAAGGEVEGCEVAGGSEGSGIVLAASDGVLVRDCSVSGSEDDAIRLEGARDNRLVRNVLNDNTVGIELIDSGHTTVARNSLNDNGVAMALVRSEGNEVRTNRISPVPGGSGTIFSSPEGIVVSEGGDNHLVGNTIDASGFLGGIDVAGSTGNLIEDNTVTTVGTAFVETAAILIRSLSDATVISDNDATSQQADGIRVQDGATGTLVQNNLASRNGLDGIHVLAASTTIAGNTANDNAKLGIEAAAGVIDGGGNRASGNGDPAECVGVVCSP